MRQDGEDWVIKFIQIRVESSRPAERPRKSWLQSMVGYIWQDQRFLVV